MTSPADLELVAALNYDEGAARLSTVGSTPSGCTKVSDSIYYVSLNEITLPYCTFVTVLLSCSKGSK
jgi:hypothetical protein